MDIYYFYDSYGNLSAIRYIDGTVDNLYYVVCNSRGDVEAFYNGLGTVKSRYIYDSWGNVIKVVNANGVEITNQNDVAFINPIRYRGYYYDSETGLYYLKSCYYDPQVGRFINADGYASTGQGVIGNNMFAYCGNNPVNFEDPNGEFFDRLWDNFVKKLNKAKSVFAVAGGITQLDSPVPGPADLAGAAVAGIAAACCLGSAAWETITSPAPSVSIPKVETKEKDITLNPLPESTVIYRYGGTNPGNLTSKEKDLKDGRGLSFSTTPAPGCSMTTISAINSTGVVYAVKDGATHVSVYPIGDTMEDWVYTGSGSIWTAAVKFVVVKWDGGK